MQKASLRMPDQIKERGVSTYSPSLAGNLTVYSHHSGTVTEEPELLNC